MTGRVGSSPRPRAGRRPNLGVCAPNPLRRLLNDFELSPLLVFAQHISGDAGRETALRAERELTDVDEPRRVFNPAHKLVDRFDSSRFGGHQTEHDNDLFADESERLEAAGPFGIVLEQQSIKIKA